MKRRASAELSRTSSKKSPAESTQSQDVTEKVQIPEEIKEEDADISLPQKIDQGIQVHFPEDDEIDCKIFVCIKYINMITCDAETQAFIPVNVENYYNERGKNCGSDFLDEDKLDNTQSSEIVHKKFFKSTAEFGEMSSISDFR